MLRPCLPQSTDILIIKLTDKGTAQISQLTSERSVIEGVLSASIPHTLVEFGKSLASSSYSTHTPWGCLSYQFTAMCTFFYGMVGLSCPPTLLEKS